MASKGGLPREEVEEIVENKFDDGGLLGSWKLSVVLVSVFLLVFLVVPVAADNIRIEHNGDLVLGSGVDLSLSDGGGIDAGGGQVENVGDPVEPRDLVNKGWVEELAGEDRSKGGEGSGSVDWIYSGAGSMIRGVAVDGSSVYAAGYFDNIHEIGVSDGAGQDFYSGNHGADITDVVVDGGNIISVSRTDGGSVHKSDGSGSKIWSNGDVGGWAVDTDSSGNVYVAGSDGTVYKLNGNDGGIDGTYTGHSDTVRSIAVGSDHFYSGGDGNQVHQVDISCMCQEEDIWGNDIQWTYNGHTSNPDTGNSAIWSISVDNDGYVYSGGMDRQLHKIDNSSGSNVWKNTDPVGTPMDTEIHNGNIYLGDYQGTRENPEDTMVYKIALDNNETVETYNLASMIRAIDVDENGNIYTGDIAGDVTKILP